MINIQAGIFLPSVQWIPVPSAWSETDFSSQLTCSEAVCDIVELLTLVPGADIVARLL